MKKLNKYSFLLPFFAAVLLLASCEKMDEEKPVIHYVHNTGVTDHDLHADAGSAMSVDIKVSDNKSLKQLKIEIYKASAAHLHSTDPVAFKLPQLGQWDTIFVKNIADSEYTGTFVFNVPDTISGAWIMEVTVLDDEGNINTVDAGIMVNNPLIPLIVVQSTNPVVSANGNIQISQNNSLELTGFVVDMDTLDYVKLSVIRSSDTTWTEQWQPIDNWTFNLDQVVIPPFVLTGTYRCVIEAGDITGRYHYATANIVIVP